MGVKQGDSGPEEQAGQINYFVVNKLYNCCYQESNFYETDLVKR